MEASVVISRVYQLLGDTGTTKVYSEPKEVIPSIAAAQRIVLGDRPDAHMATGGTWPDITDPTASNSDMMVDEAWTEAVANQAAFIILITRARTKLDSAGAQKFRDAYRVAIGAG